jgi:benzoyl-CoA-dihydrodiol lyase
MAQEIVTFDADPASYQHWQLSVDGAVATLTLNIKEDATIRPGYQLKLNSYDLGVDIEFHDALQRIRFEHPEVGSVILTSGRERIFCSGANIYMLGTSSHAWKVNFCKFTNETRNGIEDASAHSGLKFIAAVNGACAGGGYEMALACDEIYLIDDRSSAVSLPEVPLLGVLPGTGGLTRVTDKRKVRRDLADIFCTNPDGVRGQRAKDWKLVDEIVVPSAFKERVAVRARELAAASDRPGGKGVTLTPIRRAVLADGYDYDTVGVKIDKAERVAVITLRAPKEALPETTEAILAAGVNWWPLALARDLDNAILILRLNHLEIGTWILKIEGEAERVLQSDRLIDKHKDHWFVRETLNFLRRTLARLDVSARSLFAIIEPGSCFAGTLLELALAADRSFMLDQPEDIENPAALALSALNFGGLEMVNGKTRLATRFYGEESHLARLEAKISQPLKATEALALGLVTFAPDELDWDEEVRVAIEERAALSPDALTGLEANLRFPGTETMDSRIFGRLSAWQNWIFIRPNAVGDKGALKLYGSGTKANFNWERV